MEQEHLNRLNFIFRCTWQWFPGERCWMESWGKTPTHPNNFNLTNDVRKRRDCPSADWDQEEPGEPKGGRAMLRGNLTAVGLYYTFLSGRHLISNLAMKINHFYSVLNAMSPWQWKKEKNGANISIILALYELSWSGCSKALCTFVCRKVFSPGNGQTKPFFFFFLNTIEIS